MSGEVLLCARDERLIESVEISAAALEVPLRVTAQPDEVAAAWPRAPLRLVGAEVAGRWGSVAPGKAFVLGDSAAELARCSAALGLPVLQLPESSAALAEELRQARVASTARGQVVAVLGASGGVGVSTLVAALALGAAARGRRVAAVDLAQGGGGLDLLFGAETEPGLRWADLAGARGELGPLAASLPAVRGARFVAQSRQGPGPDAAAVDAVLGALSAELDLVFVDAGRRPPPVPSDRSLLMVAADVRGVAAARMLAGDSALALSGLVLRRSRHRSIPASLVEETLGLDCLGVVGEDRLVAAAAEQALPPAAARRFQRQVSALLRRIGDE